MARLYVDENLLGVVEPLRQAGHDVLSAGDSERRSKSDAWHFREALEAARVLLTLDKRDYTYFHRLWTTLQVLKIVDHGHGGILVAVQAGGFTQDGWLGPLGDKLMTPEDIAGRLFRWLPAQNKWEEDAWRPEE